MKDEIFWLFVVSSINVIRCSYFPRFWKFPSRGPEPQETIASNISKQKQVSVEVLKSRCWDLILNEDIWGEPCVSSVLSHGKAHAWTYQLPPDAEGSENLMIKAKGIVRGTPHEIFDLIFDSNRAKEYNRYSIGRVDIEIIDNRTKIVWNRSHPPMSKKPHEFCTFMYGEKYLNGTCILFSTATDHQNVPNTNEFLRSEILLGANIMIHNVESGLTELVTINHVKTNGVPIFLCNKFAPNAAVGFLKELDELFQNGTTKIR